jgi:hypothetical protein
MRRERFTQSCRRSWPVRSGRSFHENGSPRLCGSAATDSTNRPFPPWVVLWAFLGQVLDPDHSCRKALARIQAHRAALGLAPLSEDTGGYCKARSRLPEALFAKLFRRSGEDLAGQARPEDLWRGRVVKVVDGSSSSMPDTPENQKEYPQPSSQQPGCGFPVVAYVAVFCLATGAALDLALGKYFLHDLALFYHLRDVFLPGEICLADRGFCSYAEIALFRKRGVDTVLRLHQARQPDFRRGRAVGVLDHIVTWQKPKSCPRGLRKKDYRRLPATLTLREVRYRVEVKGYRTQEVTLVTTLLDAEAYPGADLAELYFRRWEVELDFRHLKTTMQMDVLRGKSPEMVRKEIWTHLLAYNLIRTVMHAAAEEHEAPPRRLSLKGTMQHLVAHRDLVTARDGRRRGVGLRRLLSLIAGDRVPYRPHRLEPRVRKRRPKNYPLMTQPRAQLKDSLCA